MIQIIKIKPYIRIYRLISAGILIPNVKQAPLLNGTNSNPNNDIILNNYLVANNAEYYLSTVQDLI